MVDTNGNKRALRSGAATMPRGIILGLRDHVTRTPIGFHPQQGPEPDERAAASKYVTYSGDGHLMCIGATGSSKTSGPVISNALTHPGQLISVEVKGDVYAAVAER
ncbi:MAG: type IV secretory system conjugative DNA transfer family protein, partial [Rhodocyclaceae bacterium]|nr:type IV secretory system conjugative DNA transfer family protein [Rhodocyclaceae bacterium]